MTRSWFIACFSLAALGCNTGAHIWDSIEPDPYGLNGPPQAHRMHSPYLTGTFVELSVDDKSEGDDLAAVGWRLISRDSSVFEVLYPSGEYGDGLIEVQACRAKSAGVTTVEVRDSDNDIVIDSTIEVIDAERVELFERTSLELGSRAPLVDAPKVAVGGTATFFVRFMANNRPLHWQGRLEIDSDSTIDASGPSFGWLTISPRELGVHTIQVGVGEGPKVPVIFEAVDPSEIAGVVLRQDQHRAKAGDTLAIYAQSVDASGEAIYGVDYEWSLDGQTLEPASDEETWWDELWNDSLESVVDVFHYTFDPSRTQELIVRVRDKAARIDVHAGAGTVGSSNVTDTGCSVGGTPGPGTALMALASFSVVLRRRSQHRRMSLGRVGAHKPLP